jgi:hypothetical protein
VTFCADAPWGVLGKPFPRFRMALHAISFREGSFSRRVMPSLCTLWCGLAAARRRPRALMLSQSLNPIKLDSRPAVSAWRPLVDRMLPEETRSEWVARPAIRAVMISAAARFAAMRFDQPGGAAAEGVDPTGRFDPGPARCPALFFGAPYKEIATHLGLDEET